MASLPPRDICLHYTQRDQHSFDFLVCEGARGWSATHTLVPFAVMMLLGNFLVSFLLAGGVEVFEVTMLVVFKSYLIFHTNDAELETKAGSLLGDWAFNDLFGILSALLLLRLLKLPGLVSPWTAPFLGCDKSRQRLPFLYRLKLGLFTLAMLATGVLPTWIIPEGCDNYVPSNCINIGMIVLVVAQSIFIVVAWVWLFRRPDDYTYLWGPARTTDRRINLFFGLWLTFIVLVGLQNAQPYMPLFIFPEIGEFAQVWAANLLWVIIVIGLLVAAKIQHKRSN